MINVVPFLFEHLDQLDPLPCYDGEPKLLECARNFYGAPGSLMHTLTSIHGEVVCVYGGLTLMRTMSTWAIVGKQVLKYPLAYHRTMGKQIDWWFEELRLNRMQSVVEVENERALKQHLKWGFEVEGRLRKSRWDGKDQFVLAKVV